MKLPRPTPLTVLTAALLILLPALALLQYRWVGQVAAAERERMQTHLRNASLQFREALDGEVARAVTNLQIGALTAIDGASDRYADRYEAWASTSAHPDIVENVYLVDEDEAFPRVRRWDTASRSLEATEWPAVLRPWRASLESDLEDYRSGNGFGRPPLLVGDESLALVPMRPPPTPPGAGGPVRPAWGFTVVHLNMPFIRTALLPELTERYFAIEEQVGYRVAVLSTGASTSVIYRSDADAPSEVAEADAVTPLLGVTGRVLFARGGRGGNNGPLINVFRLGVRDEQIIGNPRDAGHWMLLAQHRSGSLERAVASARRRNLGISFGTLMLLSVTVLMLTTSSRRAERLARQQMEFVAGVSHELRTPIAVIRSASENLAQGVVASPERVRRYGDTIGTEARRLGDMVERVLQYAGIEAGHVIASTAPIEPRSVVAAAVEATAPIVAASGVRIEQHVSPDLPLVLGDGTALASAVQNLITNAVKYGGDDRWVGITVSQAKLTRGTEVRISVEDHGQGIPSADLPHLFEPFFRGAAATSAQIQGNGLGLSIVRKIVEAHGGRVTVSTRPGSGTTFTLHLPAAPPTTAAVPHSLTGTEGASAHS